MNEMILSLADDRWLVWCCFVVGSVQQVMMVSGEVPKSFNIAKLNLKSGASAKLEGTAIRCSDRFTWSVQPNASVEVYNGNCTLILQ